MYTRIIVYMYTIIQLKMSEPRFTRLSDFQDYPYPVRIPNPVNLVIPTNHVECQKAHSTKRNSLRLFLVFEVQLDDSELENRQLNASG